MSDNIIQLNEDLIKHDLKDLVRSSVEETLNALLDHEADELVNASKYERTENRNGYRSDHDEMNAAADLVQNEIKKNALEPQDQAKYQKRYDALTERFNTAKQNLADAEAEISRKKRACSSIRQFLDTLGKQKKLVTEIGCSKSPASDC